MQYFCLADYVSKVDVIYPKGNKLPEKVQEKSDDDNNESFSNDESEEVLKMRMVLRTVIVQTYYTKQRMEQDIRKEKYLK